MTRFTFNEELVLHPNPTSLSVGAVFFGICGLLCLSGGKLIGWIAIAFSLVSLFLLLWMAFSPHSRLRLSRDGFCFGTWQRVSTYRWTDVERFFTTRFAGSHRVGFAFAPHCRQGPPIRWLHPPFYGRFLPNDYGMTATDLAALLESWRVRFTDVHDTEEQAISHAMLSLPSNEIATRGSWKILPLPTVRAKLGFAESYAADEFERMKRGLIPKKMEDKWFIFFEESWLYFHRSWTGPCIYAVRFEASATGASAVESWVSRDSAHYRETRADYERALVKFLIDAFLLGKPAIFPVPSSVPVDTPKGLYQHALVGRAYPESVFPAGPPPVLSVWSRVRRLLRKRWDWFVV